MDHLEQAAAKVAEQVAADVVKIVTASEHYAPMIEAIASKTLAALSVLASA